ncbi:MAG: glycoside hydrolase family 88 protein [Suipraeoptans sp.]
MLESIGFASLCMTRQCWEQGILSQAFYESNDTFSKDNSICELMVRDIVLRQSDDGRLCNVENTPAITDSSFCIPSVLGVSHATSNDSYLAAAKKNIDYLRHKAPCTHDGVLYHIINTCEIWADSAAFTPYSMSLFGYHDEAFQQMKGLLGRLKAPNSNMYYHMWNEDTKAFIRDKLWGIGNGWILTGLMRLYLEMPKDMKDERSWLYDRYISLLDSLLSIMTIDGKFHDILDDQTTFFETETSAMVAYTLIRSIREGIIDSSYLQSAKTIRKYVLSKVSVDGLVMDCASSPDFIQPGTSIEGQAHTLMMEVEFAKIYTKEI